MSPFDLPPWDQLGQLTGITETLFVGPAAHVQLAKFDSTRIILVISGSGGGTYPLSTVPNSGAVQGVTLTASYPAMFLNCRDNGPLCMSAWYISAASTGDVTVMAVSAVRWDEPNSPGLSNIAHGQAPPPTQQVTQAPGVKGLGLLDYWRKITGRG